MTLFRPLAALLPLALAGCLGSAMSMPGGPTVDPGPGGAAQTLDDQIFASLPQGSAQMTALCGRTDHADAVFQAFCGSTPKVTSLPDLERTIGLFNGPLPPQFALTGHSSSLVAREVSAINPRAIIFTAPSNAPTNQRNDGSHVDDPGFVAMGFVRGEQLVELVAQDPSNEQLHFYLLRYTQACNASPNGCTPGDLLTPAVEKSWTSTTLYEDSDLKNSVVDCLFCHQPDGPGTRKMLRMQERIAPWTHWFRNNFNEPGGMALLSDFHAAHGSDEDYGGIPASLIDTPRSDPAILEALVENNSVTPQPNEFNGAKIEQQVDQSSQSQPAQNMPMGQSSTWDQIYAQSVAGNAIPVPYHDVKVTDPDKLASAISAYQAVKSGQLPASSLPDIRDVFLDQALPDLSFAPKAGLDGAGILVQMCQRCHNPNLDPTISRAKFDTTQLASMSRAEKDLAIARLQLPDTSIKKMPPVRFGALSADQINTVVDLLKN